MNPEDDSHADDVPNANEESSSEISSKNDVLTVNPGDMRSTKHKEKENKYELSSEFRKKLEVFPEILDFIKMLQKCIEKQRKKLKKTKKEKTKTKSVLTQTNWDNQKIIKSKSTKPKEEETKDNLVKSVTEEITEAAQQALQHNGFVYEETSGLYYDYNSGYYYNAEYGLYYDGNTGTYLKYNQDTKTYEFHSQTEVPIIEDDKLRRDDKKSKRKSKKRVKSKREEPHDEDEDGADAHSARSKKHKRDEKDKLQAESDELEDGECSDLSETTGSGCSDENESDLDVTKQYPPCMRIIIEETSIAPSSLKQGSLHMITVDGGSIGREGTHSLLLPEINTSKHHAKITFDIEKGTYCITDVGSRNGTLLNGKRLAPAKVESEPHEVSHGSRIQIGSTILLCHVHSGSQTCGHCEPGLIQTNAKEAVSTTTTKNVEHKHQLRQLRKKFGLSQNDQGKVNPGAGYKDRAAQRRTVVGSQNPHEKTQTASLTESIAPDNKGFKLLSKMGWKEGEALGKDNQGRLEPVELVSNPGTSGMGATSNTNVVQPVIALDLTRAKNPRQNVWTKTQERYKKVQDQVPDTGDIFDLTLADI